MVAFDCAWLGIIFGFGAGIGLGVFWLGWLLWQAGIKRLQSGKKDEHS